MTQKLAVGELRWSLDGKTVKCGQTSHRYWKNRWSFMSKPKS